MSQSAPIRCTPHHTALVMNRRFVSTFGGVSGTQISFGVLSPVDPHGREKPNQAVRLRIHHISNGRIVPYTTVDSTFLVLLCLRPNGTFCPATQKSELLSSPFGATVRARR